MKFLLLSVLSVVLFQAVYIHGHGKMMKPVSRSSVWRDPQFSHLNPPPNWSDNELYCGGAGIQHGQNGGKCGSCGDAWHLPTPRENENTGHYGRGIIVGQYQAGQTIDVEIDLNAAHLGHFEWRLCELSNPNGPEVEECFTHLLQLADGSGHKLPVLNGPGWYKTRLVLPSGVRCARCVLQWHYRAGNGWGQCEDGSYGLGCGPQETFRNCADITIA